MKVHETITSERIMAAIKRHTHSLDNPGFCVVCGADADGIEPDARKYTCEECNEPGVYGAEELAIMLW